MKKNHTFSASWLRSSVVSVLISVKTGISPNGETFSRNFFIGDKVSYSLATTFFIIVAFALHYSIVRLTLLLNKQIKYLLFIIIILIIKYIYKINFIIILIKKKYYFNILVF